MRLTQEVLEACYRAGAFPMDDGHGRIGFYRSDPRSILELDALRVSKSLARVVRKGIYEVRLDHDFEAVIRACADRRDTWIGARSEEHTSELQSRQYLVCRLLLEKKEDALRLRLYLLLMSLQR